MWMQCFRWLFNLRFRIGHSAKVTDGGFVDFFADFVLADAMFSREPVADLVQMKSLLYWKMP